MRTTVTLEPDVAAAIERVQSERSVGVSEAVNELIRSALVAQLKERRFVQRTHDVGVTVDVTNVWRTIEEVDGPAPR